MQSFFTSLHRHLLRLIPIVVLGSVPASCDDSHEFATEVTDAAYGYETGPLPSSCRPPPPAPYPVKATRIFDALAFEEPTLFIPSNLPGQWLVLERKGRVLRAELGALGWTTQVMLDIHERVTSADGEAGLLGIALSPDFPMTGEVFLSYTAYSEIDSYQSRLSRFVSHDGGLSIDSHSEEVVLEFPQVVPGHNGGRMIFGPDRLLYFGSGDGWWGDPYRRAQDPHQLYGKVLRLDVLGGRPYLIPNDNPFAAGGGLPEIFALGFRNPWGLSFDDEGKLWLADVGQDAWEEINIVVKGGNYGWPIREGTHCFQAQACEVPGAIDPVFEYPHIDGFSVSGGHVYRGSAIPQLRGKYVFGDFISGRLWSLEPTPEGRYVERELLDSPLGLVSIAEGADHEIYVADFFQGGIHRLDPTDPRAEKPSSLRSLGCLNPLTSDMDYRLIPYDVNSPLWSDGLDKHRWFSVPEGGSIHVAEDGNWYLPPGSVVLKTFEHQGRRIETRMLVREEDRWLGYAFEWNEAQTDAVLLTTGKTRQLGDFAWQIPSRAQCFACHTAASGRTLGFETAQLNRSIVYPTKRRANQIATFGHVGLLDTALDPASAPRFADPSSDAPATERARAYLHANCSHCHRPFAPGGGNFDLRAPVPEDQARLLCARAIWGSTETQSAVVVAPGHPEGSVLLARMGLRGAGQMPPLGSSRVDPLGVELVSQWIRSLGACDVPSADTPPNAESP